MIRKMVVCFLLILPCLFTTKATAFEEVSVIVEITEPRVKDTIEKELPDIKMGQVYDTLFHGFALYANRKQIEQLKLIEGVKDVYPIVSYKVKLDESVPFIGGEKVRQLLDDKNHHLTGKGIKVGVIDTGIDYTHPDLKENYHGGFDIIDKDHDPMETKATEGLPTMHGTHVAGIIAANGKVKGVAPEAKVYAYRALGPGGVGTTEQVIAAIEKAVEDGMDVINLSLGNSVNGPDWSTSIALNKAVEKGVIAVTSSGNSGPGLWTVGSPGTASKAISVGASFPPVYLPVIHYPFDEKEIPIQPLQGSLPWEFTFEHPIIYAGKGKEGEITEKVSGKIVLVERGDITFTEKAKRAEQKGAKAVLIYNNEKGQFAGSLEGKLMIPVASISKEDGEYLKLGLDQENRRIATKQRKIVDKLAAFSSRGPVTHTWEIKPDVVAPGVFIDSTVPGGYTPLQGTSMAAPHVAGAVALLKQAHPTWSPRQIKAALMNTAKLLYDNNDKMLSPYEQGSGRIQLEKAVNAEIIVYPGAVTLGKYHQEETRKQQTVDIIIENTSDREKSISFELPKYKVGVQWKLPKMTIVKPHEQKRVKLTMDLRPSVQEAGLHHGLLTMRAEHDCVSIPYLYVIEEPNYPRVMGFQFGLDETEENYEYELYLPEGAEEAGVALYDPDTLTYKGLLFYGKNIKRGLIEKKVPKEKLQFNEGFYKAIIFAKKEGKEDVVDELILVGENGTIIRSNQTNR